MQVKAFSIKWKRNMFCLELMCFAPSGKERIIKLYLPLPVVESLVARLRKAIEKQRGKVSEDEKVKYIG
jgi:hypothetical protein